MKENNNKMYIINVNSIIYLIVFLLILMSTIFFISKGMGDANVTIQSTGEYKQDQVIAIEAVANNVTGRINNTIAVSAIFFAVIVSSVSVFQFVKVKDFDKEINDVFKNMQLLNKELSLSRTQIDDLKYEINKMYNEKNKLKLDNVKTQLELNIYKINKEFYKNGSRLDKVVKLIDESINLTVEYPGTIDDIEVSKLYYKRAYVSYDLGVKNAALYFGNIALEKVKDKYPDMEIEDFSEMAYVENLAKLLINIYLEDNNYKLVDNIINEIKNTLEHILNDRLAFLYGSSEEEAMEIIEENYKYYGKYFLTKFKKYYDKGSFDEFKKYDRFIKFVEKVNQ